MLGAPAVQAETAELAAGLGMPAGKAEEKLTAHLRLLVPTHETGPTRLLHALLHPALSCWDLQVDRSVAAELRQLGGLHPLVFLPAHRGYADPMLLATTFRAVGLPPTIRFAGDNLSFWPIGPLGRRTGSVFIRRNFAGDRLYTLAIRSFIRYAVRHGHNLEWYPEGTRSRTGQLSPFRHGLTRTLVEVLDDSPSGDAYVVPVTISYELLPDAERLVAEDAGRPKRPEGVRWLIEHCRASRRLRGGRAWISFGTPFSIREHIAPAQPGTDAKDDGRGVTAPGAGKAEAPASGWRAARAVGRELDCRLRAASPVTPGCLLILVLTGGHREPRDVWQIMRELKSLMAFIGSRKIPGVGLRPLSSQREVQRVLGRLVRAGAVAVDVPGPASPSRYRIGAAQAHLAAFYREQTVHWFVTRAIAELALATATDGTAAEVESWALRLHGLLGGLIPLPEPTAFLAELHHELAEIGWPDGEPEAVAALSPTRLLAEQPFLLGHRVLGGALEAALAAATAQADSHEQAGRPEFPGGQGALTGRWPESRSQNRWRAATAAATRATAAKNTAGHDSEPDTADRRAERRRAYVADLAAAVRGLDLVADLDVRADQGRADQGRAAGDRTTDGRSTDGRSTDGRSATDAGGPHAEAASESDAAGVPPPSPAFADSRPVASSGGVADRNDEEREKP
ncbi:1-acyl-sn-glycerol-3-phosphate acyltransferase [Spirillospora sp. NPDC048911]|uniref:1-acyl-sn-glycerol-3-phosphate acyltransferase n=1 Tax=Spirillospora sp. NPDC048911 TaxID=3364527 RepID=UPI003713E071